MRMMMNGIPTTTQKKEGTEGAVLSKNERDPEKRLT